MSTVALVVNPTAGRGRGRTAGARTAEALRAAGHDVVDLSAPSLPLAQESADAAVRGPGGDGAGARPGVDALVVVGGDGMVHLGVNATAGTGVPLGIVAVGTGNDFAHGLGLPTTRTDRCVDAVLTALGTVASAGSSASAPPSVRAVDAARVTGEHLVAPRWYAGVLSAGIDAAVNAHANAATWPRGRSRYARSALTEITRYRPYGYRVTLRGVPAGDELPDLLAGAPLLLDGAALGTSADAPGAQGGRTVVWESPGRARVGRERVRASAAASGSRRARRSTTACSTSSSRARSGAGARRASSPACTRGGTWRTPGSGPCVRRR
ncbi:diacylglycerol/lipid kinase family protein [Cellulosimicrobium funkei]|uniref:diacylglycerol/lipid kinase family protein n=1 Tax=Cellulosimicrobium funkei TaxID=264251 RepID=UPI00069C0BA1|nr:diacylglycerol kinase family protein [Cellulosimicrobium funkei]